LDKTERQRRKVELDRMAAMRSRLGGRGYQVREDQILYGDESNDFDFDSDLDEDAKEAPGSQVAGSKATGSGLPLHNSINQTTLPVGSEQFVAQMQNMIDPSRPLREIPKR
jgi:hypothetical protein